jgi:hypothetical protein
LRGDFSAPYERRLYAAIEAVHNAEMAPDLGAIVPAACRALVKSGNLNARERLSLRLIYLEGRQQFVDYSAEMRRECEALAENRSLPSLARLRAARIGIRAAEFVGDAIGVKRICALTMDVHPETPHEIRIADEVAIVAALASRDLPRARNIAERQLTAMQTDVPSPDRWRSLLNLRVPFWFDCDFDRVKTLVDDARRDLHAYPSPYRATRADDIYTTHCVETMRLADARAAMRRVVDNAKLFGRNHRQVMTETGIRLAIARRDTSVASSLLNRVRGVRQHGRVRAYLLSDACITYARLTDRERTAWAADRLAREWSRIQQLCPFDYPAAALAVAYVTLDMPDKAKGVLDYFAFGRVTSNAPSPFVRAILSEFHISPSGP